MVIMILKIIYKASSKARMTLIISKAAINLQLHRYNAKFVLKNSVDQTA